MAQIYTVNKSIKTSMRITAFKFTAVGRESEVRSGRGFTRLPTASLMSNLFKLGAGGMDVPHVILYISCVTE